MERLKPTLINMFLSLTVVSLAAGAILAEVNSVTAGPISVSKTAQLEAAIKEVTPPFNNKPSAEAYMAVTSEGDSLKIYPAKKDNKLVGVAVESNTMKGFGGEVDVLVGFDDKGTLLNYYVLKHAETPGLGAKMQDWFHTKKNHQCVIGIDMSKVQNHELKVKKDGGDVDAITAATISSRAFLNAINRAYSAYMSTSDAESGATEQVKVEGGKQK